MTTTPVVSDKMHNGLKPIAVESTGHVLALPCVGTAVYMGDKSPTIILRIQHNLSGHYVDPTATRFKFTFQMTVPALSRPKNMFCFERGSESLIRRSQIQDIQGQVLEDIDNYNLLYAVTEICTGNLDTEQGKTNLNATPAMVK